MGARTAGLDHAEYGGLELDGTNTDFEQMRVANRAGLIKIHEAMLQGLHFGNKVDPAADLLKLNEEVLSETGDPRLTYLPKAAVIATTETGAA